MEIDICEYFELINEERCVWETVYSEIKRLDQKFCEEKNITLDELELLKNNYFEKNYDR